MLKKIAFAVIILGIALQVFIYNAILKGRFDIDSFGNFFFAILCYLVCLYIFISSKNMVMALTGSLLPLLVDLLTYYSVFIKPQSSTAGLAFMVVPALKLFILLPLGLLIGYGIDKDIKKTEKPS